MDAWAINRLIGAAAGTALLLSAQAASPQTFNQAIVFGDSSMDSGWFRWTARGCAQARINAAIAQGGTVKPVGVGLMSSEVLAGYFGLSADPANAPGGGTNYAVSGARTDNPNLCAGAGAQASPSTTQQVVNYLASVGGKANPSALYLIGTGGNDITFALESLAPGARNAYVTDAANDLVKLAADLKAAGAKYIIVRNQVESFGSTSQQALRTLFNTTVWSRLAAAGVNVIPADFNAVRVAIGANPSAFGFTSIAVSNESNIGPSPSACTPPTSPPNLPAGTFGAFGLHCINSTVPSATNAYLTSANSQQTSLFSDGEHLSAAGQKLQADYFYSLIVAPGQISFLAEAPIKTRTGTVQAILNQIPLSFLQPGVFHTWVSGNLSFLKMNNYPGFPDDPGTPAAVTAGFDYRWSPELIAGAAISAGTTRQTFSIGGDYRQSEIAGSIYAAYRSAPYWVTAIAGFGALLYDVNRQVPIGITTQPNYSSPHGTNFSLAIQAGYNFTTGSGRATGSASGMPVKAPAAQPAVLLTHGPLAGIVLQRVRVDGFTEFSPGGFTALSFESQTRNSAVLELGYHAYLDIGRWQPFAKASWNRELADTDRLVMATLTTTVAPSFSMPAVLLGKEWGTGVAGTRVRFSPDLAGYVAGIGQVAQGGVANYGVQFGVNARFNPGGV
jgi:outer membrane lipase/esterase